MLEFDPLDEYPIHQVPLSMRYVGTSDRNVYDRCIFQGVDHEADAFFITGMGVYPNLGVIDAYAPVRTTYCPGRRSAPKSSRHVSTHAPSAPSRRGVRGPSTVRPAVSSTVNRESVTGRSAHTTATLGPSGRYPT